MTLPKPWCVERLELENFRGFEFLDLDLEPETTVLIGENGAGKTAVLGGLAIMLATVVRELGGEGRGFMLDDVHQLPYDLDSRAGVGRMEMAFPVTGVIRARLADRPFEWSRKRQNRSGRTSWARNDAADFAADLAATASKAVGPEPVLPVIAVYGVERLVRDRRSSGAIGSSRFDAYAAALDSHSDMRRLTAFLRDLTVAVGTADAFGDDAGAAMLQLRAIDRACTEVLRTSGWGSPRWTQAGVTLSHPELGTLPLAHLAAGIRITAGLVIDLASRAARANPTLTSEDLLSNVPGVVLIDEVDLHLHPSWQQHVLDDLRRTFPRVQFIVTTHSPQVLSSVPANQIRVIHAEGVRRVGHSRGLRSDIILDTVMQTAPEPEVPERAMLEEYMRAVYHGRGRDHEVRSLRDRVETVLGGVETVPELADADAFIDVTYNDDQD